MEKVKDWLRLFRAQTAPATILLILTPYLTAASLYSFKTLYVSLFALLVHWISFGHNSLLDTAMGYDLKDPSKRHHPLVAGRITLQAAHNVIHWSLSALALAAILICLHFSPNPLNALISIFIWFVFGLAYNSGLSKECILGFVPISVCFTAAGSFGWFLSHNSLDYIGALYLAYSFCVILFQIGWSGHLKDLSLRERSNFLIRLGAEIKEKNGAAYFSPGKAWLFAWLVKGLNLLFAYLLLWRNYTLVRLVITVIFSTLIISFLHQLTKPRRYLRNRELLLMSIMEILSIYLVPWLMLDPLTVIVLEIIGVVYFFGVNRWIWSAPFPKV
ncbi:MAG: UbiA family prenyltransferase [Candidatus Jordarchaeales archaeon]